MKNGTKPTKIDHRDFDFHKSHRFGFVKPSIPNEYFADAGLTMPNQEVADAEFTPPTPPMPFGCTDFTHADLRTDLTKQITNPSDLEAVTHANALGGYDIRASLNAAIKLGWFKQYFNISARGIWDWFDSFRLAQTVGIAAGENRSISWGTPWFPSWEQAALEGRFLMPMPTDNELTIVRNDQNAFSWHDSKLDGFSSENGILYYRDKSWQGTGVGRNGFIGFPREVINMVMGISGTVAFTATNTPVDNPLPIDTSAIQWILSFCRMLLKKVLS